MPVSIEATRTQRSSLAGEMMRIVAVAFAALFAFAPAAEGLRTRQFRGSKAVSDAFMAAHKHAEKCLMPEMLRAAKRGDTERVELLKKVLLAETTRDAKKAVGARAAGPRAIVDAEELAGRFAAEEIVRQDFEKAMDRVMGDKRRVSPEDVDRFVEKLKAMSRLCGNAEEGKRLASDFKRLRKQHGGKQTVEEATLTMHIAEYVEQRCRDRVFDLDYFTESSQFTHTGKGCSSLLQSAGHVHSNRTAHSHGLMVKSVLALHGEGGELGHDFVRFLQKGGGFEPDAEESEAMLNRIHRAAASPKLSAAAKAQLHYIERLHLEGAHGTTRGEFCESHREIRERDSDHWIARHRDMRAYHDCLCVQHEPMLVCDGRHGEALQSVRDYVVGHRHGKSKAVALRSGAHDSGEEPDEEPEDGSRALAVRGGRDQSAVVTHSVSNASGAIFGPCKEFFSCSLCAGHTCVGQNGVDMSPFVAIQTLLSTPTSCMSGSCEACWAVMPPAEPASVKVEVGAAVSQCRNLGEILASFHVYINVKVCMGGELSELVSEFGLDRCQSLGTITFYPFLLKLVLNKELPVFSFGVGLRGNVVLSLATGNGLTGAVHSYCRGKYDDRNYRDRICQEALQTALDVWQRLRNACGDSFICRRMFKKPKSSKHCTRKKLKSACMQPFYDARGSSQFSAKGEICRGVSFFGVNACGGWRTFISKTWRI